MRMRNNLTTRLSNRPKKKDPHRVRVLFLRSTTSLGVYFRRAVFLAVFFAALRGAAFFAVFFAVFFAALRGAAFFTVFLRAVFFATATMPPVSSDPCALQGTIT